ncbi:MAG: DegT/DnrJ/EryC1/StrS family aminotransferase [Armatimonadota bacterium]
MSDKLALHGGEAAVTKQSPDIGLWPTLSDEDEQAVLNVLRSRNMSGTDLTFELEKEYAAWEGSEFALACNNGTSAIHCAMYGLGIGRGDEVITPTWTFWATHTQLLNLGATPVFCDLEFKTLCADPVDIERRLTDKTKAIIVVHMGGYSANMDAIMDVANRHGLGVLEDYSHSHASTWKGKKVGSIGHVGAASIMSEKPLATGEGGMMNTNDRDLYERAIMFGHGDHQSLVTNEQYKRYAPLPWGGYKYRMHQMTSAMARVQLRHYDEYRAPGVKAMERFFSQVCAVPGVNGNFPLGDPDRTTGASYWQMLILDEEITSRVPNAVLAEAIRAEGAPASAGGYFCHHLHPFWNECDVYGDGKPTRIAFSRDVRQGPGDCPVAESIVQHLIQVPRMTQYDEAYLDQIAAAYVKVLSNLDQLEGLTSEQALERSRTRGV